MFCKNCGSNLPDDAKFCPNCGTTLINDTPPAPNGVPNLPKKICCPECGSKNLQYLSETEYSTTVKTKGYSGTKGCLGFFLLGGPLGMLCGNCGSGKSKTTVNARTTHAWICKDCGNKFKTKEDLEQEIAKNESTAKIIHAVVIFFLINSVFDVVLSFIFLADGDMATFLLSFGAGVFMTLVFVLCNRLLSASTKKRIDALKEELDELEKKMARFQ